MKEQKLFVYNTLSRTKEEFIPIRSPFVGMYLCGPTVYGDPHLGHARSALCFDILFRTLQYLGYKVRYVRNITDVGHLENDADEGEDKIAKKARVEQLEPMEVAQQYTNSYHKWMDALNILRPSIEPRASGHVIEQVELIQSIINKGLAYESQGSVYFDVPAYADQKHYGILSGRKIDELQEGAGAARRELDGQEEKRSRLDFALWKKADPSHIMRWNSPWGEGFPGWHIECTAMSSKYLGSPFDIHCGGMDLLFPHHECEIAQSEAGLGHSPARYWMHNNMITINGQKMGKSLGNFITLEELFSGQHPALTQAFSPSAVRFFVLQAHYRSTLDFSNDALIAADKGCRRLLTGYRVLQNLKPNSTENGSLDTKSFIQESLSLLLDDLNTPMLIAHLFEGLAWINKVKAGQEKASADQIESMRNHYQEMLLVVMGLKEEEESQSDSTDQLVKILIDIRNQAKANRDFKTSDAIRDQLLQAGIQLRDSKEGTDWDRI